MVVSYSVSGRSGLYSLNSERFNTATPDPEVRGGGGGDKKTNVNVLIIHIHKLSIRQLIASGSF